MSSNSIKFDNVRCRHDARRKDYDCEFQRYIGQGMRR